MRRVVKISLILPIAFIVSIGVTRADPIIFSNLGAGDTYDGSTAFSVSGSTGPSVDTFATGQSFVPIADFRFDAVDIALSWVRNTNAATVSLTSDIDAHPGSALESFQFTNLPRLFSSNTALAVGDSLQHPLLHAGTRYWIVATAVGDAFMAWAFNNTGQSGTSGRINDESWKDFPAVTSAAFRVRGTEVQTAVPEPTSLLLLGPPLIGVLTRRMRRTAPAREAHVTSAGCAA